jgi:hypothetical protein
MASSISALLAYAALKHSKLIRQTAVVVEREPDCPRRLFDRGGAAAFGRRHQSRGRGFPLRAMSRPGQRDNERAGVTQRMKFRPIRQRDRAGELACPFWFPPKRHGGQAAPNCWLAFASLACLLLDGPCGTIPLSAEMGCMPTAAIFARDRIPSLRPRCRRAFPTARRRRGPVRVGSIPAWPTLAAACWCSRAIGR